MNIVLRTFTALTFRRILNFLLNEGSYYLSLLTRSPRMAGLPWSISIEPTTSCNLHCAECPTGQESLTRPGGNISMDLYSRIINELSSHLIHLTLYFQGEPMLHGQFIELIRLAKKRKIIVTTSTNGHFLDQQNARSITESGLDHLVISLDGTDQETYEKYRIGGRFDKVILGIENLVEWKNKLKSKTPFIEIQFLVLSSNEHQVDEVRKLASRLKADKLTLKSAQLNNPDDRHLTPQSGLYSRYKLSEKEEWIPKNTFPNQCHRLWHAAVITWNGQVLPCCFDKNADHIMGNLSETGFRSIWNNIHYKTFRKKIFLNRKEMKICLICNEGL